MSEFIEWIAGQAEEQAGEAAVSKPETRSQERSCEGSSRCMPPVQLRELPSHNFAKQVTAENKAALAGERSRDIGRNLWLYRKKTTALLQRYMRWSLEAGRVPSLLGREFFRATISAQSTTTFEARVIFIHDVEGCLNRLQDFDRQMIARLILQEYDHEAAARILQCDRRTIERRLPELIDELSEAFLKEDLLDRLPETDEEGL
jgi:DNA-directed RNA polymerase specialized sigma24 family protein